MPRARATLPCKSRRSDLVDALGEARAHAGSRSPPARARSPLPRADPELATDASEEDLELVGALSSFFSSGLGNSI